MTARRPRLSPRRRSGWLVLLLSTLLLVGVTSVPPRALADPIFPTPKGTVAKPPAQGSGLGSLVPLVPARVRDTRTGVGGAKGAVRARSSARVTVRGHGGVPTTGVTAVVVNVTVTAATKGGYLTAFPTGAARPGSSSLNFLANQTVANLAIVKLGSNGQIDIYNGSTGTAQIIVDVTGWYATQAAGSGAARSSNLLRPLVPARVRDTRTGVGGAKGAIRARSSARVTVRGHGGVPATGVTAVVVNVTVTGATKGGYLTAFPTGAARPGSSSLNFLANRTVANLALVKVGSNGQIDIYNGSTGTAHVIVDVTGWYGPGNANVTGGLLKGLVPARVRDTRTGVGGAKGAVRARSSARVTVRGHGGVPTTGVTAVVVNVTVTGATKGGYLTAFPTGAARPGSSSLNFLANQTVANLAIVKLGSNGQIDIYNGSTGTAQIIVDVTGYFTAGSQSISPTGDQQSGPVKGQGSVPPVEPTEIPKSLQRSVQPDLRGLGRPSEADSLTKDSMAGQLSATPFPVGDWGYLQTAPDPAVGRLYNVDQNGTIVGFCSGTVVARNLVLTAAHCLNSAGYVFAPQQFGSSFPYGVWSATAYIAATQYQGGRNQGADWGYLIFNNANASGQLIGDTTGYFPIHSDPVSGLKYSVGYPSEGWFHTNCATGANYGNCFPVFCSSTLNSSSQYALEASDSSVSYGGWWSQGFGCYMTGGSSGGPVFQQIGAQWYVVGVNSHVDFGPTYTDGCGRKEKVCAWYSLNMWAPYFNQVVIDYWNSLHA